LRIPAEYLNVPADRISIDAGYPDLPAEGISVGTGWRISRSGYPDIQLEYPDIPAD
jgi:hypothetical protein